MHSSLRCSVLQDQMSATTKIVIWQQVGAEMKVFAPQVYGDEITWTWLAISEEEIPPATFLVPRGSGLRGEVLQELVNELATQGIVAEGRKEAETVLAAKDEHLKDLRELLFRFDWINLQRGTPVELEREKDAG